MKYERLWSYLEHSTSRLATNGMKAGSGLPAGTFYSEPSKAPHYSWAKDGEVIIQITGVGPSGKTFISADNK